MKNLKLYVLDALIRQINILAAYEKSNAFLLLYSNTLRELRHLRSDMVKGTCCLRAA